MAVYTCHKLQDNLNKQGANMNTYIVTLRFNDRIITREYEFSYSMDAANTMLDDQMDELNNLKTGFTLTCIVKKD